MFESFGNSIVKGLMTFTLLLFSSYEGNDASFSHIYFSYDSNTIVVESRLESAFENDFDKLFKIGKEISVNFIVTVEVAGSKIEEEYFTHDVIYNSLEDTFLLKKSEINKTYICQSYDILIDELSKIEWEFNRMRSVDNYVITIRSYLDEVYFEQMDKEFNLMLLWKNKQPQIKERVNINYAQ